MKSNSGNLGKSDETEEEVDGGEARGGIYSAWDMTKQDQTWQMAEKKNIQVVLGLDDQAPSSPDKTSAGKSEVLSEGELLNGTREVGDTGKDKSPLFIVC